MRPNPDRARLLAQRGYCAAAIVEHMNEEQRDVTLQEVQAWLDFRDPPQMVVFRGERVTLASIARAEGIDLKALRRRVAAGMEIEVAIGAKAQTPAALARKSSATSPWRRYPTVRRQA